MADAPHTPALPLSSRLASAKPSLIMAIGTLAKELKAEGKDVVSLSVGVPGFLPPAHVHAAAKAAIDADSGDYGPGRGEGPLLAAWRAKLERQGTAYSAAEVGVQTGGKGALFNVFLSLLGDGEKVVMQAPYWASYPEMVQLAGGEPLFVSADAAQDYKITPAQLRAALQTPGVKAFLFNNPSNPTGMLYSASEVAGLAKVLVEFPQIWVIADTIYEDLLLDGAKTQTLLQAEPTLRGRYIVCNSVSKSYGMPGWRVGLLAGPKALVDAVLLITSQSSTHVPQIMQAGAAAALAGDQTFLDAQRARLQHQRDLSLDALTGLPGVVCPVAQGAFYLLPSVAGLMGKQAGGVTLNNDEDFCRELLTQAGVAVVPGSAFGMPDSFRLSYAGPEAELKAGLERLKTFVLGMS